MKASRSASHQNPVAHSGLASVALHTPGHGAFPELVLLHVLGHGDEVAAGCGTSTDCAMPTGIDGALAVADEAGAASNRCTA
jgi:hypothetical protein